MEMDCPVDMTQPVMQLCSIFN